ncbi:MAG: hypothetical protein COA94_07155 [Rickettsiales bacterium]|nr:MAG: hypothetical protein COA94_07155 [Rickettsiales bacterium]
MDKINVCVLTLKKESENVKRISSIFSDEIYNLILIPITNIVDSVSNVSDVESHLDTKRMLHALDMSKTIDPEAITIILKDTSIFSSKKDHVLEVIKTSLEVEDWDLVYLNRWLDRCDLYTDDRHRVGNTFTEIIRTRSPNGTQAIMFSVIGRDRILGVEPLRDSTYFKLVNISIDTLLNISIENSSLFAYVIVPNLVEFDIGVSSTLSNLAKMSECRAPPDVSNKGLLPFTLFLGIVICTFLLMWAYGKISKVSIKDSVV